MTEPFVFHFKPNDRGQIEALYMLDVDCECALCGHVQFQRFYHSAPFHGLTLVGLEQLADDAASAAGYECENCGESVGPDQVRRLVLAYGFSDDAGVIRVFDDITDDHRNWELTPRRRLDPQVVPRWTPDADAFGEGHRVVDHIDEEIVDEVFGRPFNPKLAWRDFLQEGIDTAGRAMRIADGMWAAVADSPDALDEAVAGVDVEAPICVRLDESLPADLATHRDPEGLDGRWRTWVPDAVIDAIDSGQFRVAGLVDARAAIEVVERTFDVARLEWCAEGDGRRRVYREITAPTDVVYDRPLSVQSVLRRAVYTGTTPGEAGRLTAEEIVGVLLKVW